MANCFGDACQCLFGDDCHYAGFIFNEREVVPAIPTYDRRRRADRALSEKEARADWSCE
jgi:hypothetical protein